MKIFKKKKTKTYYAIKKEKKMKEKREEGEDRE